MASISVNIFILTIAVLGTSFGNNIFFFFFSHSSF